MLIHPKSLDDRLPPTPADPLGAALHSLRMSGTFYSRSDLTAPWGLGMPPMPGCLWFHVVTAGRCSLHADGLEPVELSTGDLAMVPHGRGHDLRSDAGAAAPDVTKLPQQYVTPRYTLLQYGGGGTPTTLICGVAQLEHPMAADVLGLLPPVIHLDATSSTHASWMETTLRLMAAEAKQLRPGGETIITRLADVLVIQTIRLWLQSDAVATKGWVGALRDPQIGRPLTSVHRAPERDWSLASLAAEAGMSRSGFAARFKDLVGESPMQHVTRVRMRSAQRLLQEERTTVAELAARLGYRSEAAFSRAFKRFVGISPGAARRALLRPPED